MHQEQEPSKDAYPLGRGYGHDYMRGGEVLGGYGYSNRVEYERPRGELPTGIDLSEGSSGDRPR
jgi:hypothetical protein